MLFMHLKRREKKIKFTSADCVFIILVCAVRHYFALATNPGEQFNYFVCLAAWLLRSCGRKMDQPQEVCNSPLLCSAAAALPLYL